MSASSGRLLEGKCVVVTGAASGLGAEICRLFASEGAHVLGVDVADEAGEAIAEGIRASGGDARYRRADVRRRDHLEAAVAAAEQDLGRLDIMVANAGIIGNASFRPTEEVTDADWHEVIDVNLSGTFRSFAAALPALRRAGGGALTATSSVSGVYGTLYRAAYSASKGGINALVRSLAPELAPDRIRVNAVAAGSLAGGSSNIERSLGRPLDEVTVDLPERSGKARVVLDGRDGVADVAKVHLFLCSDLAAYVSGETVVVDGGFGIWNGT